MTATPRASSGDDFATLLRQSRCDAGLTQAELAARAGLAVRTVREAERGRTARPHRTTAVLLADALGLRSRRRAAFLAAARGDAPSGGEPQSDESHSSDPYSGGPGPGGHPFRGVDAVAPPAPGPVTLPTVVSPVGREDERDGLVARVCEPSSDPGGAPGPLTLVGVAGVGKTTLAVAVAHRVADEFPGGVTFLSAGEVERLAPEELPGMSGVSGARGGSQPVLLVVDAVERAGSAQRLGAVLGAVLAQSKGRVRVLATGRLPTGLPDERCWPVTPLEAPPPDVSGFGEVAAWPAAGLFLTHLAQVRRDSLADDETTALVSLLGRLGGHPLALALAAGHGRTLRLPEILARYGDRILELDGGGTGTPDGGRGASPLRRAVAESWRMLPPSEREALQRLAVFRQQWSTELAEQLLDRCRRRGDSGDAVSQPASSHPASSRPVPSRPASGDRDPVRVLDRLVAAGVVAVCGAGEHRFRVVEVVRHYAREQTPAEVAAVVKGAHAEVVAEVAGHTAPERAARAGRVPATAVSTLDRIAADVWAALAHAANADPSTALRLAACLPRWWARHGRYREGRRWLQRLLADQRTAEVDPVVRAWAQLGLGELAYEHGEATSEEAALAAALAEFRRRGEVTGQLAAARAMSAVCQAAGRYAQARQHATAALDLAQRHGRVVDAALAQLVLADDALRAGRVAGVRRRLAEVDRLGVHAGDRRLRLLAQVGLAEIARAEGRWEEARAAGSRVLGGVTDPTQMGGPRHLRRALTTWAQAAAALGYHAEAERALARLRQECPAGPALSASGGVVEARLASSRGDEVSAAEWFAAAAAAAAESGQRRLQIEATVELAVRLGDSPRRRQVRRELARLLEREDGELLPREQRLLGDS